MAHGLEVKTSKGFVDYTTSAPARVAHIEQVRTTSGSANVPDFDDSLGFMFIQNNHQYYWLPNFEWDNASKTLSWSPAHGGQPNDNIDVYFFLED